MTKVSPLVRSLNSGVFSALMEGRTDHERYPASMRNAMNYVLAPQGPAIGRSGTGLISTVYDEDAESLLVPFVFSETDFYQIEFADERVRFFTENGLLTYAPVVINVTQAYPFQFKSGDLAADVGDQVAFEGFPDYYNMNGEVGNITAKSGAGVDTLYTIDIPFTAGLPLIGTGQAARVYHIASPYVTADLPNVFDLQSLDTIYLYHPTKPTQKLQRKDTYNWAFTLVNFIDGPYLTTNKGKTTLSISSTGKATPSMTTNTAPSGVCGGSSVGGGSDYYMAFDASNDTFWYSNVAQSGIIQYTPAAAFVCDGYSVEMGDRNSDINYTAIDFSPSNFTFEGYDGANWIILDKQVAYVLYDNNKSVFFKIPNITAYSSYRLNVTSCTRNGPVQPTVGNLVMRSPASISIGITASDILGINNDLGFAATDVGRLIRIQGSDGNWRSVKITAFTDTMNVTADLLGEPFPDLVMTNQWRLGAYSDTTGYPNCAAFHEQRMWMGGSGAYPDLLAASQSNADYETLSPTSDDGTVLDTNGICVRLNSTKLALIKWLASGKDGLLCGTGSEERVIRPADASGKVITPANIKADRASARGSSSMPALSINESVLFGQRGGRTIREMAYEYTIDGYKTPSMTQLSSHLGIQPFKRQVYAAEPFSIVWYLRADGSVVGFTYDRDENVVGWHPHDFSGGVVESMSVVPASDQRQDVLWMIIRRTINGQTRRFVEKLMPFWDFDTQLTDAWFVDCALMYDGDPTQDVYGLQHLEGRTDIYGLGDGIPIGPLTVADGHARLDNEASKIVLGIGFDAYGETSRLENGAQDGTAQGKVKRINNISLMLWSSYGGQVGVWNDDTNEIEYADIGDQYPDYDTSQVETITLFTGIVGPVLPEGAYEKNGSVAWKRPKESPLPFNIVALMPQMNTQDR